MEKTHKKLEAQSKLKETLVGIIKFTLGNLHLYNESTELFKAYRLR